MEKRTFIFLYEHLMLGGIEKTLIDQIRSYSTMGIRIIWLRYGSQEDIFKPWISELSKCQVEIVKTRICDSDWFNHSKLSFNPQEVIYAVAFEPIDFVRLEILSQEYSNTFNIFYQVPHFAGKTNYLEEVYLTNCKQKKIISNLAEIYNKWYINGNLTFFSYRHIEEMCNRYKIPCLGDTESLFVTPLNLDPYPVEIVKKRAKREEFKIVTCGRFEFPHKGYIFGLVKAYCGLKEKYPQLKLDIIGYGAGANEIRAYVLSMPAELSKDITFLGAISPDKMKYYFNRSHLNISVAYSLLDGAKTGLVSIPVRHYTYECEGYGFLAPTSANYLDNRTGKPVEKYIEKLINMSEENYVKLCHQSYEYALHNCVADPNWLFNKTNKIKNYYEKEEIRFFKKIEKDWKTRVKIIKLLKITKLFNITRKIKKIIFDRQKQ